MSAELYRPVRRYSVLAVITCALAVVGGCAAGPGSQPPVGLPADTRGLAAAQEKTGEGLEETLAALKDEVAELVSRGARDERAIAAIKSAVARLEQRLAEAEARRARLEERVRTTESAAAELRQLYAQVALLAREIGEDVEALRGESAPLAEGTVAGRERAVALSGALRDRIEELQVDLLRVRDAIQGLHGDSAGWPSGAQERSQPSSASAALEGRDSEGAPDVAEPPYSGNVQRFLQKLARVATPAVIDSLLLVVAGGLLGLAVPRFLRKLRSVRLPRSPDGDGPKASAKVPDVQVTTPATAPGTDAPATAASLEGQGGEDRPAAESAASAAERTSLRYAQERARSDEPEIGVDVEGHIGVEDTQEDQHRVEPAPSPTSPEAVVEEDLDRSLAPRADKEDREPVVVVPTTTIAERPTVRLADLERSAATERITEAPQAAGTASSTSREVLEDRAKRPVDERELLAELEECIGCQMEGSLSERESATRP
jgi:hypothetical protein